MRTTRVHVDTDLAVGGHAQLEGPASEKLTRVLRLRRGDTVALFNGDGFDYLGTIEPVGKGRMKVLLSARNAAVSESPLKLTLLQSLARGERMDWILQKATELGVAAIQPVISERTGVKLDADRTGRRMRHWMSVIHAACEQSGRAMVPTLAEPIPLHEVHGMTLPELRVALHPDSASMRSLDPDTVARGAAIAVGPEGGFSEADLRILDQSGFLRIGLGPRILRTETAGAMALAVLQALFGDMG